MLAFVQVLAPELVIVGIVVFVLGALLVLEYVILPVMDWLNTAKLPWWKRAVVWPVRILQPRVKALLRKLKASLSRRLIASSPPVARWLHQQALVVEQLSGHVAADAQWTYEALRYVRTTLVPTLIERAVAPVRATANTALKEERATQAELVQAGSLIRTTVRGLPWGVPNATFLGSLTAWLGSYRALWAKVWTNLEVRVTKLETGVRRLDDRLTPIEQWFYGVGQWSLAGIKLKIGRLETLLAPLLNDPTAWLFALLGAAMVPAISGGAFRSGLGNLFCRNTQTLAKEACAADSALLDDLLLGAIGLLAVTQVCELLDLMYAVAGFVGDGIAAINREASQAGAICGGSKAGELNGYTA